MIGGMDSLGDAFRDLGRPAVPMRQPIPAQVISAATQPSRTAAATERIAAQQSEELALARAAVELSQQSLAASEKVERFTRRMAWASLVIAIASLSAAIVSVAIAVVALNGG